MLARGNRVSVVVELNRFVSIQSTGCFYIGSWWSGCTECPGRLDSPGDRGTPGYPGRSEVPGSPRWGGVFAGWNVHSV